MEYPVLARILLASNEDLNLSDFENALEWGQKNVPDAFDYDVDAESDFSNSLRQQMEDRVKEYSHKYSRVMSKPMITLYRAVRLFNPADLNLKAVGTHWSFEKEGAGSYGAGHKDKGKDFFFTGIAKTKDIDWEYGFTSFLYYGEDQWECALNQGSKVQITEIDGKKLKKPLEGKA